LRRFERNIVLEIVKNDDWLRVRGLKEYVDEKIKRDGGLFASSSPISRLES